VRDKLLRVKDGHDADIDLAIDDMKGKDFATELEFWCKRKGAAHILTIPHTILLYFIL
jgi:hypothetical protein